MTMKHMLSAAAAASACALFATSTPEGWADDFDAAKAQAKSEGKLLLVDFSGSDWCGWCKKLDKEVFATPEFLAGVKDDYVLVMVDSPSNKSLLSDKAKEQNPKLVSKYKVSGYPTVLIMDPEGEVVEKTGYRDGGPQPYVEYLRRVRKAAAKFIVLRPEIANLKKGDPARLAKIDGFLSGLDNELLESHAELADELLANDPDGTYAARYPVISVVKPVKERLRKVFLGLNAEFLRRTSDAAKKAGVKRRDLSREKQDEVRKEVDVLAFERLTAFRSEVADAIAKAPESVKGELKAIDDQVAGVLKNIKKD